MDEAQARRLGNYLKQARERRKLGIRELGRLSGLNFQTILRIERGDFLSPGPDKLKALAQALGLRLTDVWSLAGYQLDDELPSPLPFLRAKYRDMPDAELEALTRDVDDLLRSYGIDGEGRPAPGEDEEDDQDTAASLQEGGRQ